MLLYDFKDKGFPVSIHTPVICVLESEPPIPVYNRFDLKKTMTDKNVTHLLGIWPGKKCTDGYPLDVKEYSQIPVPPETHKNIDSAIKISVFMESDEFSSIIYTPGIVNEKNANIDPSFNIESKDKKLYTYIKEIGLKHSTMYD